MSTVPSRKRTGKTGRPVKIPKARQAIDMTADARQHLRRSLSPKGPPRVQPPAKPVHPNKKRAGHVWGWRSNLYGEVKNLVDSALHLWIETDGGGDSTTLSLLTNVLSHMETQIDGNRDEKGKVKFLPQIVAKVNELLLKFGARVKAGQHVVLEVEYHPADTMEETDRLKIHLAPARQTRLSARQHAQLAAVIAADEKQAPEVRRAAELAVVRYNDLRGADEGLLDIAGQRPQPTAPGETSPDLV